LIRAGSIPAINIGKRLTRISRSKLEEKFTRRNGLPEEPAQKKKLYSLAQKTHCVMVRFDDVEWNKFPK